jgi:hypothetical protein
MADLPLPNICTLTKKPPEGLGPHQRFHMVKISPDARLFRPVYLRCSS